MKFSGVRLRETLALSVAAFAVMVPANAQGNAEAGRVLETVTVTAQKKEQDLLDVGIAVSVLGQTEIAARRISSATDLIQFTPNASVKENIPGLMPIVTIRGIGLNDFNATNNPATGVYVDEVSLSSLALLSSDLFDLERMEVLKGPQGTLYGRNSTAGALNIISAKPDLSSLSGRVSAGVGNFASYDAEAFANIPLSETLAFRVSGKGIMQDEGFYFDESLGRDVGRRDVLLGRVQALWQPSDRLDVLLKIEGQRGRSELGSPEFFGLLATPSESNCPGQPGCSNFFGYNDLDGDPFRGAWSVDPAYNHDQFGTTLTINSNLGWADLTSVTGYINFSRHYSSDVDASPLRLTDFSNADDVSQFSQEIRLSGQAGAAEWQTGVFFAEDDVKTIYAGSLQDLFNTTLFSRADQNTVSKAVFGNVEWSLSEIVSLIAGLRYTDETRGSVAFTQDNVSQPGGSFLTLAPFGTPPIILASVDDEINDGSWSWKLGLNWKPVRGLLVYGSASQGTKSGGFFSGVATSSAQLQPYTEETLIAYEVGIKGASPEVGLRYEASAFYYDYSDVQTFIRDTSGAVTIQRLGNVDEAEVYGADIVFAYRPAILPTLDLNAGIGLLSTELGAFDATAGLVPAGNALPDAPELTLNLGASYEVDLSSDLAMRLSLDGRYQSEAFRDAINDPLLRSEAYWVTNARISLMKGDEWDVSIWGKNIGERQYVTQGINQLVFGNGFRVYGAPRTYGISLTRSFK